MDFISGKQGLPSNDWMSLIQTYWPLHCMSGNHSLRMITQLHAVASPLNVSPRSIATSQLLVQQIPPAPTYVHTPSYHTKILENNKTRHRIPSDQIDKLHISVRIRGCYICDLGFVYNCKYLCTRKVILPQPSRQFLVLIYPRATYTVYTHCPVLYKVTRFHNLWPTSWTTRV